MGQQILEEQATPATPAANKVSIYPKAGGGVYKISDDGVEHQLLTNTGQQTIPTINLTGGQIAFPATAVPSADPNTLDDYEEGAWTPTYTPGTGSFTTLTMDVVARNYIKIGNSVSILMYIRTDDVDITGASGPLRVTGLPFSGTNLTALSLSYVLNWGGDYPISAEVEGIEIILYYRTTVNGTTSLLDVSDIANGTNANFNRLRIGGTYILT